MIFHCAVQINWDRIHNECQKTLAASNAKEEKSRITKQYLPGDQVLIILDSDECRSQPKMNKPTKGPYIITRVHTNGTVEIDCGIFTETIDMRRLKPFIST